MSSQVWLLSIHPFSMPKSKHKPVSACAPSALHHSQRPQSETLALLHIDGDWRQKSHQLQARRWRKIHALEEAARI